MMVATSSATSKVLGTSRSKTAIISSNFFNLSSAIDFLSIFCYIYFMSKKLIFLALFLALAFPTLAPAQTFSIEQENKIQSIIQQITDLQIQILLARIAELQIQIAELLAKQVITEQKVETVIQQTASVLGSAPVTPTV